MTQSIKVELEYQANFPAGVNGYVLVLKNKFKSGSGDRYRHFDYL